MLPSEFQRAIRALGYGKNLPDALYIVRPENGAVSDALLAEISRAETAASPGEWNILKLHTNQFAITFLLYPDFDLDPHPALAQASKINLNTGAVVRTDYRSRANPPILHRKETFLPPGDPRIEEFAALTRQEEEAGLYRDPSRIGLRAHWLSLLARRKLTHLGHKLVTVSDPSAAEARSSHEDEQATEVARHRTAIKRYDLSKPVKQLLERGLLRKGDTFFDYGCGHGMDIEALQHLGYSASGWDPAFRPHAPKQPADIVNLGYVLNVIEDASERRRTLREACSLAKRLLIVSTLAAGQESDAHTRPYRDGFLTKTNTFQKFYAPGELESLIEEHSIPNRARSASECASSSETTKTQNSSKPRGTAAGSTGRKSARNCNSPPPSSREQRRVDRYELHNELLNLN